MSGYEAPYGEAERLLAERKESIVERVMKLPLKDLTLGDLMKAMAGLRYTENWGPTEHGLNIIETVLGKSVQTRRLK